MKLRVLIVDDDPDVRWSLAATCKDSGCEVLEAGTLADGAARLAAGDPDLVLLDINLPDGDGLTFLKETLAHNPAQLVVVMTGYGTIERAVAALTSGAFHFLTKPFGSDLLLTLLDRARELVDLRQLAQVQAASGHLQVPPARGAAMAKVEKQIAQLATTSAKILLLGPSGSGKTFIAQRIHQLSGRKGRFIAANCGAINAGTIESELFGHEKGSFTDAHALKKGYFEQAHGGTLLLDEIGDMPLDLQVKLLKVVEEGTITRMGGEQPVPVDVRLICATHQDLAALVRQRRFREDLYYRLNVGVIVVPPLRERGYEDFLALAEALLAQASAANGKRFRAIDPRAGELLYLYPWPGNVRELRNILERIAIFEEGEVLSAGMVRSHLMPLSEQLAENIVQASGFFIPEPLPTLDDLKTRYYDFMLERCEGNLTQAARLLGISRKSLERYRAEQRG
ncbi:MAG TPA: sigma-54 dependent transcriptional regulator [bacterium]|nr:sigma-54 dependent transcriptional regulator [bacterium]